MVFAHFIKQKLTTIPQALADEKGIIQERGADDAKYVFTEQYKLHNLLNDLALTTIKELYDIAMYEFSIVVYIRTDPNVCIDRKFGRGNKYENRSNDEQYWEELHQLYEKLVLKYQNEGKTVFIINGNQSENKVLNDVHNALQSSTYISKASVLDQVGKAFDEMTENENH